MVEGIGVSSGRCLVAALAWMALVAAPALAAGATVRAEVPTRGCPTGGQTGDLPPPHLPARVTVAVPAGTAAGLAYYRAAWRRGILAPAGWTCAGTSGSTGHTLTVAPPGTDLAGETPQTGPAVIRSLIGGGTSGRFRVAAVAARAFPAYRGFARGVAAEGGEDPIVFSPYPGDRMTRPARDTVVFATPAGAEGLGTLTLAPAGAVDGFARIGGDPKAPDLDYLAIRLGPADAAATAAILAQALAPEPEPAGR